jgi:NADH-quinone oxidoreductase subunit J
LSDRSYLSPSWVEVVFVLLGAVVVASGLLVVVTRHLVHAALWLVVCLGGLAGCFLLLTADFVAWVQVLIYVGAVVVLLLFGLMLTRAPTGPSEDLTGTNRALAAVVGLATATLLVTVTVGAFRYEYLELGGGEAMPPRYTGDLPAGLDSGGLAPGSAEAAGSAIFRHWVLPFEVLSVLLLAALVGAIVLSRRDIGPAADPEEREGASGSQAPGRPEA